MQSQEGTGIRQVYHRILGIRWKTIQLSWCGNGTDTASKLMISVLEHHLEKQGMCYEIL